MARECGAICRNFSILPGFCRADRAHRGNGCAPLEGSGTGRWLWEERERRGVAQGWGSPPFPARRAPREHRCPQGAACGRAQQVRARECREGTATLSSLPSRSRASYLQLQATLRALIIFQPRHPSFPWHPAAPAGAETQRKGVEGGGSLPRSGVFPWPDPAEGIQGGRYRRPWRWRGWLGE